VLLAALERGDREELLALVAPNATWDSDGGGNLATDGEQILAFYRVLSPDRLRHLASRYLGGSGEDA
jgi:ketosteroid isomerase-like protein